MGPAERRINSERENRSIKFACGLLGNETQNRDTGSLRKQRKQTYEHKSGCVMLRTGTTMVPVPPAGALGPRN